MDPTVFKEYGPLGIIVAVLLWFLWLVWKRNNKLYDDLAKRVRQLENERAATIADLANRMMAVMRDNTDVLRQTLAALGGLHCVAGRGDGASLPQPHDVKKPNTEPLMRTPPAGSRAVRTDEDSDSGRKP